MVTLARKLIKALLIILILTVAGIGVIAARVIAHAREPFLGGAEYVALGSSFAAGPGVGERAPGSPSLCMRSASNYPQLFAALRGLDVTDVTCAGATIQNLIEGVPIF